MSTKITVYPEIKDDKGKVHQIYVSIDNGNLLMVHQLKTREEALGFIDALRDVAEQVFGKPKVNATESIIGDKPAGDLKVGDVCTLYDDPRVKLLKFVVVDTKKGKPRKRPDKQ